jgi:hypothetical protein
VPAHPSAEVNFALLRQFSVFVSPNVTPVVFGGLISNRTDNTHPPLLLQFGSVLFPNGPCIKNSVLFGGGENFKTWVLIGSFRPVGAGS